jgi:hypothetical protein
LGKILEVTPSPDTEALRKLHNYAAQAVQPLGSGAGYLKLHYVNGVCTPLTSRLRYAALSKFG